LARQEFFKSKPASLLQSSIRHSCGYLEHPMQRRLNRDNHNPHTLSGSSAVSHGILRCLGLRAGRSNKKRPVALAESGRQSKKAPFISDKRANPKIVLQTTSASFPLIPLAYGEMPPTKPENERERNEAIIRDQRR
jgi:hypothetical protein